MTDRLRECPFCGGEAEVFQVSTPTYEEFVVVCKNHNCCAFYIGYGDVGLYPTEQKAIKAWNTRKPMDRIVQELEVEMLTEDENRKDCLWVKDWEGTRYHRARFAAFNRAIEIVKEGGKDVTTRNDAGMD